MNSVDAMNKRSLKEKIRIAIDERALCQRIFARIHHALPIYYIRDKHLISLAEQTTHYLKIEKKYIPFLRSLNYKELKMEKSDYIWICWFQGIENAPELIKICIESIKKNFPEKKIVILTDENIPEYIQMPSYIKEKRAKGVISAAHYSDLLRVALLCVYGGLWLDATVYCTGRDQYEEFKDNDLFVYRQLTDFNSNNPIVCSSWLIYARKNNPILLQTRDLQWEYWKHEKKLKNYFLFHMFLSMVAKEHLNEWKKIPMFNNVSPHILQTELNEKFSEKRWNQLKTVSSFHKLNHHVQYDSSKGTLYNYMLVEGNYNV